MCHSVNYQINLFTLAGEVKPTTTKGELKVQNHNQYMPYNQFFGKESLCTIFHVVKEQLSHFVY